MDNKTALNIFATTGIAIAMVLAATSTKAGSHRACETLGSIEVPTVRHSLPKGEASTKPGHMATLSLPLESMEIPLGDGRSKAATKSQKLAVMEEKVDEGPQAKAPTQKLGLGVTTENRGRKQFQAWGRSAAESGLNLALGLFGLNYSFVVRPLSDRCGPYLGDQFYTGYSYTMKTAESYFGDDRVERRVTQGASYFSGALSWATTRAEMAWNTVMSYNWSRIL